MKISKKKLKELIKDEGKASKEYDKLGLHNLARDEAKHKRFLEGLESHGKHEKDPFGIDFEEIFNY